MGGCGAEGIEREVNRMGALRDFFIKYWLWYTRNELGITYGQVQ